MARQRRLYLYLARRDKTGVKVLSVFPNSAETPPLRVGDVKDLNLPPNVEAQVAQAAYDDRMLWEAWIESADDYEDLKRSLRERGYSRLPVSSSPKFKGVPTGVVEKGSETPRINTAVGERRSMIRRVK